MGLRAALVDRARVVERRPAGLVVEGTPQFGWVEGPWFKVRLMLEGAPERRGSEGQRRAVSAPQLLCARLDENGDPVALTNEKMVEVVSAQLGRATWQVVGDPQPLRKKRAVIGALATVKRVEKHEAVE